MNKALFLSLMLILTSFAIDAGSSEAKQPDLMLIVTTYQAKLSGDKPESALQLCAPSKHEELRGLTGQVIVSLFADLELDEASFSQTCLHDVCKLTGMALKHGKSLTVTYTLEKQGKNYVITNISSTSVG